MRWLPRHVLGVVYVNDLMDFFVLVLSLLGAGVVGFGVLCLMCFISDMLDRTKYMRSREKKRIDDLEKRISDLERDVYFNDR